MRGQTAVRIARTRVVVADHDKLVVTYCVQDDTAYLLRPPGEDPLRVLAAARLVLPDDVYHELAWHLEVTQAWDARRAAG
ncbi:MAG TPA: hypothetical protein VHF26_13180 [Trebonia sp.]|nr:hypothetical protein [Trebonia sp.]